MIHPKLIGHLLCLMYDYRGAGTPCTPVTRIKQMALFQPLLPLRTIYLIEGIVRPIAAQIYNGNHTMELLLSGMFWYYPSLVWNPTCVGNYTIGLLLQHICSSGVCYVMVLCIAASWFFFSPWNHSQGSRHKNWDIDHTWHPCVRQSLMSNQMRGMSIPQSLVCGANK